MPPGLELPALFAQCLPPQAILVRTPLRHDRSEETPAQQAQTANPDAERTCYSSLSSVRYLLRLLLLICDPFLTLTDAYGQLRGRLPAPIASSYP